jgi:hypothetical protein
MQFMIGREMTPAAVDEYDGQAEALMILNCPSWGASRKPQRGIPIGGEIALADRSVL